MKSRIRVIPEGDAFLITYLAMDGGNAPREVRQTTVRGGGVSVPVTLATSETGTSIQEYALSGGRVASIVVAHSNADLETNGASRLFWRPVALPHPRAVR